MAHEALLELTIDLACEMQRAGAETYRVEDTVRHLLSAYGMDSEVFAIPNCIIVSLKTPDGTQLNRMRRPRGGGTNIDALERFNALCRELCRDHPPVDEARDRFARTKASLKQYPNWVALLSYFLGGAGFTLFFGGKLIDMLVGGLAALAAGVCNLFMDKFQVNVFFKTVASCFLLAFTAYTLFGIGLGYCLDASIIGPLMLMVPGLLFTNSVRDIIYGDSLSGVNRLVQVIIIALAIAVGIAAGSQAYQGLFGAVATAETLTYGLAVQCLASVVGSIGFCLLFNIRGKGMALCLMGGVMSWCVFYLCSKLGAGEVTSLLVAAAASAIYAEFMARLRRCPAIGYLLVALFPLLPGSAVYYTMAYAVSGNSAAFAAQAGRTAALAGALAIGILLVSTLSRMWFTVKRHRHLKTQKQL